MAHIDVYIPDETLINLLRREKALRVGDGGVEEIEVLGEEVRVTLTYEMPEERLHALIRDT